MSILTPTEISECLTGGPTAVARAIEQAVIHKLAAGVSVEPVGVVIGFDDDTGNAVVDHSCEGPYGPLDDYEGIYNLDQLNTAIAAARVQENERCAQALEALWHSNDDSTKKCIAAIRALLGKEQS